MAMGRTAMRWWRLLALSWVPIVVVGYGGWLFELYRQPQIVPRIVWVDNDNQRILAEAQAGPTDREALYAAVGRLWISALRARTPDVVMNQSLERDAQKLSDRKAFALIEKMLEKIKADLSCDEKKCAAGIELGGVVTSRVSDEGIRQDTAGNEYAIVEVAWQERKYGQNAGVTPPQGFTGKLRIMAIKPTRTGQNQPNPFGLYVVGYNFDQTGPVRSVAEAVR
jgi:type IV secretory pathway TrbF-like protein